MGVGGHQDLLSGVTQWTQGCFSPRLPLGMWSIMSQETPPPRGIRWMALVLRTLGTTQCTVFGDQCELGTKWDGSPLPGCQEARSEVKVDAGVRAAIVGDFHLHPGSHFVPPCPSSLGWRSWDTPTLPLSSFLTTFSPNPQVIRCPRCFVKSALGFLTLRDPGLDTCLSPRSSVQSASRQWAG